MERVTAGEIPLGLRPVTRISVFQWQNRTDADLGRQDDVRLPGQGGLAYAPGRRGKIKREVPAPG